MSNYAIGIDLGTTYSCVGVWKNNKVDIIVNIMGHRTTPSVVGFKNNEKLIGEYAKYLNIKKYENLIYDSKRLIGRNFSDKEVQNDIKFWPFKVDKDNNDKPQIIVKINDNEKRYYPEEISAMILKQLKKEAEDYLDCEVKDAIITVPAYFNNSQRQSTIDAGRIAGLNVLQTINEPTAAAIAYGLENQTNIKKNVCVFDFGGGTFDVTVLTIENKEFKVLSTGGDSHLGGADIDNLLVEYCINEFKKETGIDVSNNKKALRRLKKECEESKKNLSGTEEVDIDIDALAEGKDFNITLLFTTFNDICKDLFERCIEILKKTINESGLSKEKIDDIVLVGGSSRIPKIQEMVINFFGDIKKIKKSINTDEAVGMGASILAAKMNKNQLIDIADFTIQDVVSISYGLGTKNNKMTFMIKKNTQIPCKVVKTFHTIKDYDTQFGIAVYQGENENINDNELLEVFYLKNITRAPKGETKMVITFSINKNSILEVYAQEEGKNNGKKIQIETTKRNEENIKKLIDKGIEQKQQNLFINKKNNI